MKKEKKKLTPKQREERKQNIKKFILTTLHGISYVLAVGFIIVLIIGLIGGCDKKPSNTKQDNKQLVMESPKNVIKNFTDPFSPNTLYSVDLDYFKNYGFRYGSANTDYDPLPTFDQLMYQGTYTGGWDDYFVNTSYNGTSQYAYTNSYQAQEMKGNILIGLNNGYSYTMDITTINIELNKMTSSSELVNGDYVIITFNLDSPYTDYPALLCLKFTSASLPIGNSFFQSGESQNSGGLIHEKFYTISDWTYCYLSFKGIANTLRVDGLKQVDNGSGTIINQPSNKKYFFVFNRIMYLLGSQGLKIANGSVAGGGSSGDTSTPVIGNEDGYGTMTNYFSMMFASIAVLFTIQIFPPFTLGMLIFMPLTVVIIIAVLKLIKK